MMITIRPLVRMSLIGFVVVVVVVAVHEPKSERDQELDCYV